MHIFNLGSDAFSRKLAKVASTFFLVLYPQVDFEVEEVDGFCVSLLKETVEYCQKNIYSYDPALEMLDEMYSLGLHVRYMEAKTNV